MQFFHPHPQMGKQLRFVDALNDPVAIIVATGFGHVADQLEALQPLLHLLQGNRRGLVIGRQHRITDGDISVVDGYVHLIGGLLRRFGHGEIRQRWRTCTCAAQAAGQ